MRALRNALPLGVAPTMLVTESADRLPGLVRALEGVVGAEVFSGAFSGGFSETGVAVPNLVRNGKKGVTSKGIFSAGEFRATGLVLMSSSRLVQGSTLTRPPKGSAAI